MEKEKRLSAVYRELLLDFQTKKAGREETIDKLMLIAVKVSEQGIEEGKSLGRNQHNFSYIPETGEEIIKLKNMVGMVMVPKNKTDL
jgi:hypothetical protein